MKKIIIVEDDIFMREELEYIFRKEGYTVSCITSFEHTIEDVLRESPGLVLLDLNLPGETGFTICRELKRSGAGPVLILTSRDQMRDELHALDLGADEYLTKPCHKERLLARVSNVIRRTRGRENLIDAGGFLLDRQTYTLYKEDKAVTLAENQGKIMELILMHSDEVVTKEELSRALWGTEEYIDENALQVNMTRLKKTLKSLSLEDRIVTVRGRGYRLAGEDENEQS